MPFLYELNASDNQVNEINFLTESKTILKFLQKVDLSKNKLTALPQIKSPCIVKMNLDENQIASCDFMEHPTLKFLTLNKNKLVNGEGLCSLEKLEELHIQENETLTSIKGMDGMNALKVLNLNGSKLDSLNDFP